MRAISRLLIAVIALTGLLTCGPALAASFPDGPITLVVPYPAGGATDVIIRPLAEAAKKELGQPVVVENRGGGGGAVGVGSVVAKKPDGYTLSVVVTSLLRNAYINKLPFDVVKDLTPVMRVAGYLYGVVVKADAPYKTLQDLLDYAKANPGKLTYMASGVGTGGHIAMEELGVAAGGLQFTHIPSKGDQESTAAVLGGHITCMSTTAGWIPLVEAGQLRLLATYGDTRAQKFPDVATIKELGLKVVHSSPIGIVGPKGMPKEIVRKLHDAFKKAMEDPAFLAAVANYQAPLMYQNSEDFGKFWAEAYVEAGEEVRKYIKKD